MNWYPEWTLQFNGSPQQIKTDTWWQPYFGNSIKKLNQEYLVPQNNTDITTKSLWIILCWEEWKTILTSKWREPYNGEVDMRVTKPYPPNSDKKPDEIDGYTL